MKVRKLYTFVTQATNMITYNDSTCLYTNKAILKLIKYAWNVFPDNIALIFDQILTKW
jgi:hypothetical protein